MFQVCCDRRCCAGEDAMVGIRRRCQERLECSLRHRQFREFVAQCEQLADHALTDIRWKNLVAGLANLRRKQAHPDFLRFRLCAPERQELPEITGPFGHLPRDRAMHRNVLAFDVLENAIVGCRLSAHVVFGGKPVDGHAQIHLPDLRPLGGNRTYGAGHDLDVHVASFDLRKNFANFLVANERLTADQRDVHRAVGIHQGHHAIDQFFAAEVADLA